MGDALNHIRQDGVGVPPLGVTQLRPRHLVFAHIGEPGFAIGIERDAHYRELSVAVSAVQLFQIGSLSLAGRTPRGPEVEQHIPAVPYVLRERGHCSLGRLQGQVGVGHVGGHVFQAREHVRQLLDGRILFERGGGIGDEATLLVGREEKAVLQKQVDRGHVVGIGRDVFAGQPFEPLLLFFESLFQGVKGAVGELSGEIVLQVKSGNLLYVAVEGLTLLLVDLQPVVERSARQVGDRVECHLDGAGFEGEQQRGIL